MSKLSLSQFLTIWTEYKLIINTRLVVQMGTSDGDRAAAAALRLVDDVAGVIRWHHYYDHCHAINISLPSHVHLCSFNELHCPSYVLKHPCILDNHTDQLNYNTFKL